MLRPCVLSFLSMSKPIFLKLRGLLSLSVVSGSSLVVAHMMATGGLHGH